MHNVAYYIGLVEKILAAILILGLLLKVFLFFKYERGWDPISFFHFTKIQLKMTTSKGLRKRRVEQNLMTTILFALLIVLGFLFLFRFLTGN